MEPFRRQPRPNEIYHHYYNIATKIFGSGTFRGTQQCVCLWQKSSYRKGECRKHYPPDTSRAAPCLLFLALCFSPLDAVLTLPADLLSEIRVETKKFGGQIHALRWSFTSCDTNLVKSMDICGVSFVHYKCLACT